MARALVDKLDRFLLTFGGFERAYLKKKVRQTDFEVVKLSHNSPAEIGLNPTPRVPNYAPEPVVRWTLQQWDSIAKGEKPDPAVDDGLIGDIATLSERNDPTSFAAFVVTYAERKITFDDRAHNNAKTLRAAVAAERRALPWAKGQSLGTLTGEMRDVIDSNDERQIVILPPVGPASVRCVFPEELRERVRENLFRFVRITGLLHYDDSGPFPHLVELDEIVPLEDADARPHFSEARGLFKDSTYPDRPDIW